MRINTWTIFEKRQWKWLGEGNTHSQDCSLFLSCCLHFFALLGIFVHSTVAVNVEYHAKNTHMYLFRTTTEFKVQLIRMTLLFLTFNSFISTRPKTYFRLRDFRQPLVIHFHKKTSLKRFFSLFNVCFSPLFLWFKRNIWVMVLSNTF